MSTTLLHPIRFGPKRPFSTAGFSLAEVLVAAVVLAVGVTAAMGLYASADQMFKKGQTTDAEEIAINTDLVEIQKRNRRFSCVDGFCINSSEANSDPNETQYTPLHPSYPWTEVQYSDFKAKQVMFAGDPTTTPAPTPGRCSVNSVDFPNIASGTPSSLVTEFKTTALDTLPATLIDEKSKPIPDIVRSVDITTPAAETPPSHHAYIVTYSKANQVIRRVRMVPTVARWCP
jgi:type II secretory pathway pseudopilin PulG